MVDDKGEVVDFKFLRSIISRPEYYYEYKDYIHPNIFSSDASKDLWKLINWVLEGNQYPLNLDTLGDLISNNKSKLTSDLSAQWNAFKKIKVIESAEYYCQIMIKRSRQHKIRSLSSRIKAYAEAEKISECLDLLEQQKEAILNIDSPEQDLIDSSTNIELWLQHQKELKPDKDGVIGVRSGFPKLDSITRGFKPGELIIIGARPSVGKSALMSSMISHIAKVEPIAAFSLEMTSIEMYSRLISIESELPLWIINNKSYETDTEQLLNFKEATERIGRRAIFMNDKKHTVRQIEVAIRKTKARNPSLRVCFIDYLQIIQPSERYRSNVTAHHIIGDISAKLKLIAKELKVAVVALSQLNRNSANTTGGEEPKPLMASLKESGNIEQDADMVILLHRRKPKDGEAAKQDVDIIDLNVEKNRNGRLGTVTCQHYKKWTLFTQYKI